MGAQHPGDFLHRFQAAAHCPPSPVVEKRSGLGHRPVLPEMSEGLLQLPRGQAPGDEPRDRAIDRLPTDLKDLRRLAPTPPPRPSRQKAHHRRRQPALAFVPRYLLDHHPVLRALDSPRRVAKPGRNRPQRNMLPFSLFQLVIARHRPLAARTAPLHARLGPHRDFNPLRPASPTLEPNILENESGMGLNLVQNRFNVQLDGWSPRRRFLCSSHPRFTRPMETSFFSAALFAAPACVCSHRRRRFPFTSLSQAKIHP